MKQFTGPWIDLSIPNETILPEDLSQEVLATNPVRYAKLLLIKRIREMADYTKPLPTLNSCRITDKVKDKLQVIHKTSDPNYYINNGSPLLDSFLLSGIQTYNINELGLTELPPIMFRVSALTESNQIFKIVPNSADKLPMVYWISKTQVLDTKNKSLSDLGFSLYETEGQEVRNILFSYGLNSDELNDLAAIEAKRKSVMYRSERDYYNTVLLDRLGFFGAIGGITNPNYRHDIATKAFLTDNRAAFSPNNLPNYINGIGQRDYINFRLKITQVGDVDYFAVQWRFPQRDHALRLGSGVSFDSDDILKLYGKTN